LRVPDCVLLAAVQPPGENRDQKLKLQGIHRPERTPVRMPGVDRRPRPCPPRILRNRSRFWSADCWHRTGSRSSLVAGSIVHGVRGRSGHAWDIAFMVRSHFRAGQRERECARSGGHRADDPRGSPDRVGVLALLLAGGGVA
jgi:hypothetical protein